MSDARITPTPRKYYSEQAGYELIQQLSHRDDLAGVMVAISAKFYAVSAAAAALKYITLNYTRFALHTLRIKYQGSEGRSIPHPMSILTNTNDVNQRLDDD